VLLYALASLDGLDLHVIRFQIIGLKPRHC
jgi:hypothetical protein